MFLFLACTNTASAWTEWEWTAEIPLSGGGYTIGSGTLVAEDTISTGFDEQYAGYLVTSISGTYGGETITGLLGVNTFYGNDNLINTSYFDGGSYGLLDWDGLSFALSVPLYGNTDINLYEVAGYYGDNTSLSATSQTGFVLTEIPEPSAFAVFGLGLVGMGWKSRRKISI